MFGRIRQFTIVSTVALCAVPLALADESGKSSGGEAKVVESESRDQFQSTQEFSAVVESADLQPVVLSAEEWSEFEIVEVVPHGAEVKEGDALIRFDDMKLKLAIRDLAHSLESGAIALRQLRKELNNLEKSTPMSLAAAETLRDESKEAFSYFVEVDRNQQEESAKFSVLSAENSLRNAQEELDQLKKMYEADDLTEETEEIILKRAEFSVRMAKRSVERAQLGSERSLKILIPRKHEELKKAAEKAALDFELAKVTLPAALEQKKLDVAKAEHDREQSEVKLARLKADLKQMVVKAPASGFVFYGTYRDGKWATAAALAKTLIPGGKATVNQTLLTIADSKKLRLHGTVTELQAGLLEKGAHGVAVPARSPAGAYGVTIDDVARVPSPEGKYAVRLKFAKLPGVEVTPGGGAKVSVIVFEKSNALTIPVSALNFDREGAFVRVSGDVNARRVEVQFADSESAVIAAGLEPGEKLLVK